MFRLHHVGTLVADIGSARQALMERFGYRPWTDVITDPVQTARVQFLHLPGATHWLELVTPAGPGSKLSNALKKGVKLHHLCYEVEDLEGAAERLRGQGMLMVGAPAPAVAFGGRRIAWLADKAAPLVELVEAGPGPLNLDELTGPGGSGDRGRAV